MKYISQLRRGTLAEWQAYEAKTEHLKPLAGELVVEFDTVDGKIIPRLKIGNGEDEFTQLEYISVDSFILPKPATITLLGGNSWIADSSDRYHQIVTVSNGTITANSKVDLQPSPEQLCTFHNQDVSFTAVNEDGVITVYAVGTRPVNNHTIQVTITEVVADE